MKSPEFKARYGHDKKDIHCECGGQVACSGTVHPLADLGVGFRKGKLVVDRKYSRKTIGYCGFCFKCGREGNFILPEFHKLIVTERQPAPKPGCGSKAA